MGVCLAVVSVIGIGIGFLYIRICLNIASLAEQLQEIERGSHMELAVQSRQRPLLKLCRELNRTLASREADYRRYEKGERQLKQNITSLAHDIRTPLTGASGYVQMAVECEDDGRRAHYLQAAAGRLEEMGDMLEEMFLYTKLISEEFELFMEPLQALPLLSDCLLSMYVRFEEKGVSPQVEFKQEGFRVRGNEEAMRRIFQNLIQNALLHGEGDVYICQDGNRIVFENGVPEGARIDAEQIFDRFYKGDLARRKGSSGLGLFIVRELMRKMGGEARAEAQGGWLRVELCFQEPSRFF